MPPSLIGFVALLLPKTYLRLDAEPEDTDAGRTSSKAFELEKFLDSFLRRDALADVLHSHSVDGSARLIMFFKGGSDALTTLSVVQGKLVVRKVVSKEFQQKLKMQFDWLRIHGHLPYIVSPIREIELEDAYLIDLEYLRSAEMFTWIHRSALVESEIKIKELLESISADVYISDPLTQSDRRYRVARYLEECLFRRLDETESASPEIAAIIKAPRIEINGKQFKGLRSYFEEVLSEPRNFQLLTDYHPTKAIHGDLTIDNMLVDDSGKVLLIDPSDDNSIRGPIIDYSRLLQSLDGGYEFLNQLEAEDVSLIYSIERSI
jgi:serine/threonine protein kinase